MKLRNLFGRPLITVGQRIVLGEQTESFLRNDGWAYAEATVLEVAATHVKVIRDGDAAPSWWKESYIAEVLDARSE